VLSVRGSSSRGLARKLNLVLLVYVLLHLCATYANKAVGYIVTISTTTPTIATTTTYTTSAATYIVVVVEERVLRRPKLVDSTAVGRRLADLY